LEVPPARGSTAPPILLFHGWCDSADTWRPTLARIARRGRAALALDLPGFGEASRLERETAVLPQLDRFVAAAAAQVSAEHGGSPVVLAGNSLGGCASMRAAERDELPVAGVVAIAPAGLEHARWFRVIEGERIVRLAMRTPVPLPEVAVREAVGRAYRTLAFARPGAVDAAVVAAFTRHVRSRRDVVRVLATGKRLLPELQDPFRLELVNRPMLLVWGDSDRMVFPTGAERVLRQVPGARIEMIPRCGHCPQIEAPERLAEILHAFPAELARAA
jgi:pimeloyl-ACP methyl ester carboxylesterase